MTLNLPPAEMEALEALTERKGWSKTAVIRTAIRLFAVIDARVAAGERFYFESKDGVRAEVFEMLPKRLPVED